MAQATGSRTEAGRSLPIGSVFVPITRAIVASKPAQAALRHWMIVVRVLGAAVALKVLQDAIAKVREWTAAPPVDGRKRDPTWEEILGRQKGNFLSSHAELGVVAVTTVLGTMVGITKEVINGQFYVAQSAGHEQVKRFLWLFPLMTGLQALVEKSTEVVKAWVALNWRRTVMARVHDLYFHRRAYYHVLNESDGKAIPDADTRICTDIREACDAYAGIMSGVVQASLAIVMQYGSIFSMLATNEQRTWVLLPPLWVSFAVPIAMNTLVNWNNLYGAYGNLSSTQQAFSQALTRVQLHCSGICALHGEDFEYNVLQDKLWHYINAGRKVFHETFTQDVINSLMHSGLYPSGFLSVGTFTSSALTANMIRLTRSPEELASLAVDTPRQDVTSFFGLYIQNWWSVVMATNLMSMLFMTWNAFSMGKSSIQRVTELVADLERVQEHLPEGKEGAFQENGPLISFDNVTVLTPNGTPLLHQLSFEVNPGDRLLICGHNGAGKSSIMRCLSALWHIPTGTITRPGGACLDRDEDESMHSQIYYLPQKPCSVIGSLSDQVTYPIRISGGMSENELRSWLRCVDLEYLADRNKSLGGSLGKDAGGNDVDWEQLLSLGEQQALAIARLMYHHPQFAVLDECTSGVSSELEQRLFAMAQELGITYVTISHRPALQDIHNKMLRLTGQLYTDGRGWELTDIPHRHKLPPIATPVASKDEALVRATKCAEKNGVAFVPPVIEAMVSGPTPAQEVQTRWPTSLQRFFAIVKLGWPDQGARAKMIRQLAIIAVGMRIHCDLLWQIWANTNGAVSQALIGSPSGVLSEFLSYVMIAPVISVVDTWVMYLGKQIATDISQNLMNRALQSTFSGSNLLCLVRPGNAHVENSMTRIADVANHFTAISGTLLELLFRISFGIYSLPTLLRGVGAVAFLSPPVYFLVFRLCLLVAPDFALLTRRESELETRLQVWHSRLRQFAEPIAFSGGGSSERRTIEPHFNAVIDFRFKSLKQKFFYQYVEHLFSGKSDIPLYMQRLVTGAFWGTNSGVSENGLSPANVVQNFMFERVAMYNDNTSHRLGSFTPTWRGWDGIHCRLLELQVGLDRASAVGTSLTSAQDSANLEIRDMDLVTPAGTCLARGLTFSVEQGKPLAISGPNACGKSLLGNVLLGLWPAQGAKSIVSVPGLTEGDLRPPLDIVMTAPQRLYLPPGTLGDQVCYPNKHDRDAPGIDGQEHYMEMCLHAAGIGYLLTREASGWDHYCRWEDVLSGGEQQRMGVVRVLYKRPRFAILDECTSMVDHNSEEGLYKTLANDFKITPITISQRLFLPDIHDAELKFQKSDEQGWSMVHLKKEAPPQEKEAPPQEKEAPPQEKEAPSQEKEAPSQ